MAGHQRPDADAAVSAFLAAGMRQRLDPRRRHQPILLGEANPQTRWLFAEAGVPLPPVRSDLRPTVAEIMNRAARSVPASARLNDALPLVQDRGFSVVPVVDDGGVVLGVLSSRLPHTQYFHHFNAEDFLGQLLELPDLVAAFQLRRLNRAVARPGQGVIRLVAGTAEGTRPGDVVLAGVSRRLAREAARAGAQAVILAEGSQAGARRAAQGLAVPTYYFRGSLLALASGLALAIPVRNVMETRFESVQPDHLVDEVRARITRSPCALPVLDANGRLVGIVSRTDLLTRPSRPLILVDHFERTQAVRGLEDTEITEIIDHHRVGNLETVHPVRIDCRPVGSTTTIIVCQYATAGLKLGRAEALLALGAIVSDTLLLTSPTTTALDRRHARALARRAGVSLADFGREVLRRNDDLADGDPEVLVQRDLKEFSHGGTRFFAAQLETMDLSLLTAPRRQALRSALEAARVRLGVAFGALLVTDALKGDSQLLLADGQARRQAWLLEESAPETGAFLPGVVSRKKQLLPRLIRRLESFPA